MAAPQAMVSTTMTWCASPATKGIPWKDPQQHSARPTASGASSHQHAEVWSSYRDPAEWINDWQLGLLKVSEGCRCVLTVQLKHCLSLPTCLGKAQIKDIDPGGQYGTSSCITFKCILLTIYNQDFSRGHLLSYHYTWRYLKVNDTNHRDQLQCISFCSCEIQLACQQSTLWSRSEI